MRTLPLILCSLLTLLIAGSAHAWHARGHVYCDADGDQRVDDPGDTPVENARVVVELLDGTFFADDPSSVVSTLLGSRRLPDDELNALSELIEAERRRRKKRGKQ